MTSVQKGNNYLFGRSPLTHTLNHMKAALLIIFLALTAGRAGAEGMTRKEIKHEYGEKTI